MSDNELPPLPNKEKLHTVLPDDYRYGHIYGYTADQMREYARVVKHAAYERAAQVREAPAKVEAERDELRDVLLRNGFVPCDSPACNCGSWHHRYGLPERMREIEFALADAGHERSNDNGHSILRALNALIARLDAAEAENERLRKFAGKVLNKSCEESIDVSCGDIEDWATQCGLLEQVTMTADCGDDCKCAEWTDFPLECLFPTALGSAAIDAAMGLTRPAEES